MSAPAEYVKKTTAAYTEQLKGTDYQFCEECMSATSLGTLKMEIIQNKEMQEKLIFFNSINQIQEDEIGIVKLIAWLLPTVNIIVEVHAIASGKRKYAELHLSNDTMTSYNIKVDATDTDYASWGFVRLFFKCWLLQKSLEHESPM
jgi:hypothetical protein